jgi:hypothetical protein
MYVSLISSAASEQTSTKPVPSFNQHFYQEQRDELRDRTHLAHSLIYRPSSRPPCEHLDLDSITQTSSCRYLNRFPEISDYLSQVLNSLIVVFLARELRTLLHGLIDGMFSRKCSLCIGQELGEMTNWLGGDAGSVGVLALSTRIRWRYGCAGWRGEENCVGLRCGGRCATRARLSSSRSWHMAVGACAWELCAV